MNTRKQWFAMLDDEIEQLREQLVPGDVLSSGTARTEHLLDAAQELLDVAVESAGNELRLHRAAISTAFVAQREAADSPMARMRAEDGKIDELSHLWDEVATCFQDAAPVGTWFGAHDGDGVLFGWWS